MRPSAIGTKVLDRACDHAANGNLGCILGVAANDAAGERAARNNCQGCGDR
jgi:hypothetical protein